MVAQITVCDGFDAAPPPPQLGDLILFESDQSGSNADDSTDTVFSGHSSPSYATDEDWLLPKQVRSFYFPKQYPVDLSEFRDKIHEADQEIYQCNVSRIHILNLLNQKRAQMDCLNSELYGYISIFDQKKKDVNHLQESLGKLPNSINGRLCSAKKIQTVPLTEANSSIIYEEAFATKIRHLREKLRRLKMEIDSLDNGLADVLDKREKAFKRIRMMRRQRDLKNARYSRSCSVLKRARQLAAIGNVKELGDLAHAEAESFMSLWNSDKAYRDDYVAKFSPFLGQRRLGRNGWIRYSEEEMQMGPIGNESEGGGEDSNWCPSRDGDVVSEKTKKDVLKHSSDKSSEEESDGMDSDEKPQKEEEEEEIDGEALKEKKRQEQIAKARQALERKKKLREKAAAKAIIRSQKESEKKFKLQEMTKKTTVNLSPSDTQKKAAGEKRNDVPNKRNERYKRHGRGTEALPKAIIKRKKAFRLRGWSDYVAMFALMFLAFLVICILS